MCEAKKIKVATIGSGFIVDSFVAGARHDSRFEYAAVYSRNEQSGRAFASKYGVERVICSLEELANDSSIDAVYIASPNICHAPQAIMMMDAGKHVLCEKPVSYDVETTKAMIEAARRNRVTFMEAMKTTLMPNFKAVKEALPRIGKVRRFVAQFCQYSSRYDKFKCGGEVANVFNPAMKGGSLLDLGVYGIAPMIHLFGTPWSGECSPEKLAETIHITSTMVCPGGSKDPSTAIDGAGVLVAKYPEMEGVITYSKITDSAMPTEIQGEDGTIIIQKLSNMVAPKLLIRHGSGTKGDPGYKG
ncbi:MAG: Gfo/Idh/MocA family oxidoreductase, partial [Bacteroidales bacterium]|nr:Gfo/Idh/MocA family oxidoreductase [Bacteroidales bacterium]